MAFGERISRGFRMIKLSWSILKQDTSLIILPVISAIAFFIIAVSFLAPIVASEEFRTLLNGNAPDTQYYDYAYGFAFYLVTFTVMNTFNAALIHCVLKRLKGEAASVGAGLGAALGLFPKIFLWSLLSATVGLIFNILQQRAGALGKIVAGLAGIAWSVATYFVVPVIVAERAGPVDGLQRSVAVMRRTWGESAASNLGLSVVFMLPIVLIVALGMAAFATLPGEILVPVAVALGLCVGALILLSSTLSTILRGALYAYAVDGTVPDSFDRQALQNAFVPRKKD
ncbi:MAG: DUF6159 family protein [Pseudomonadota bacterium]